MVSILVCCLLPRTSIYLSRTEGSHRRCKLYSQVCFHSLSKVLRQCIFRMVFLVHQCRFRNIIVRLSLSLNSGPHHILYKLLETYNSNNKHRPQALGDTHNIFHHPSRIYFLHIPIFGTDFSKHAIL